ncbi:hypothetical protein Acr_03g0017380 [Actinidia rufa]|uniref:Type-1 restriction enzyme mjaxp r protein n=1 Tax=Actinidia rufa TaxID=165716 RepID=A0A7J0EEN5_9ERIC|nr:hypothetical protein Acr_03g0017380 [Actinidia rufa]
MVAEPWILRMGNQVSANLKHSSTKTSTKKQEHRETIGILSFEVANVMSKTIHLHKSLTDHEISKLKVEISKSEGVRRLVSSDDDYLLELALAERLDELNRVSGVVSRLGKKCSFTALQGFEHVYGDIVGGNIDVKGLGFLVKDMEGWRKKFQQNQHEESAKAFGQKLMWQKQDVRHLKDVSLWNQTYDKVVELLARTVCTIYAKICLVFGDVALRRGVTGDSVSSTQFGFEVGSVKTGNGYSNSGPIKKAVSPQVVLHRGEVPVFPREDFNFMCGMGPGRVFMECLSLSSSASKVDDDEVVGHDDRSSATSGCCSVVSGVKRELPNYSGCFTPAQSGILFSGDLRQCKSGVINGSRFGPKSRLPLYAPPSTVGGSALALHYANVIIVVEKLLRYPHLVGEEARDDLYQMLPTSLRMSLKTSLKSYVKDMAIYDAPLAHDWKERLDEILRWLAPLAHNMIRWQSERNFAQQKIVKRTNVLLLQTIYFADREKTEAAVCELLVGLNYICRYEHQQNALLDCASSFDFDDCVDWQMHY